MSAVYEKLLEHWRTMHAPIATPGDRRAEVEEIESRYGVTLPEDFRTYLLHASPDEEMVLEDFMCWWEISRIKNIPDEFDPPIKNASISRAASSYIFFADFGCWCHAWAVCCDPGGEYGKIAVINGCSDRIVANSFAEFVDVSLADSFSMC